MPEQRTAILFSPPLPPVRLGPDRSVCIGRHPDCEFPIRQTDVSRRHAEIRFESDGYLLSDLGSTNGTYLNNERIEGMRKLMPGDRIEIGSSTITFCEIEGAAAPDFGAADHASTVVCERPLAASPRFSGLLAEIPPSALFQLLEMGSNSGLLELAAEAGRMRVWFELGRPVHAETEKQLGFDAALVAVAAVEGQFRFGPCAQPPEVTIQASVTELLLEACRLQDEAARS